MISMTAFAVQAPSAYSNAYLRNTICGTLGIGLSKSNFGRWPSNGAKRAALPSVSFNGDGRARHTSGETRYNRVSCPHSLRRGNLNQAESMALLPCWVLACGYRMGQESQSNHGPTNTIEICLLHCRHPGEGVGRFCVTGVQPHHLLRR